MAYKHGVYCSELSTSIIPPVNTTAGLPVVVGTAPLHLASDRAAANRPVLCYTYAEAVAALGYSNDWEKYTLCEVMYSQFALYNRAPIVFINVLDADKHTNNITSVVDIRGYEAVIDSAVLLDSLVVKANANDESTAEIGVDYEVAYNDDEKCVISILKGGVLDNRDQESVFVAYKQLDVEQITENDIIGGIDVTTGASKGLECIDQVFPLYGLVPGIVLAPGWSDKPSVASVMVAKAGNINEHFQASVFCDIPCDEDGVAKYTDVGSWKNQNNYVNVDQVACWPMVKNGNTLFHMSTHLLGVCAQVDSANDDIPYESPSNKTAQITGICLADGTEVILGPEQANYLNGQGIITCLNFLGGWKIWGNRTCCYPGNTDAKDAFLCIRRMFNWHKQTFIQTYWAKVDKPINKRLIQTIIDSENIRLNGYVAQGILLGARVEFVESENLATSLLDGKVKFHTYFTPPTPAREIENVIEYDPDYFSTLFG